MFCIISILADSADPSCIILPGLAGGEDLRTSSLLSPAGFQTSWLVSDYLFIGTFTPTTGYVRACLENENKGEQDISLLSPLPDKKIKRRDWTGNILVQKERLARILARKRRGWAPPLNRKEKE